MIVYHISLKKAKYFYKFSVNFKKSDDFFGKICYNKMIIWQTMRLYTKKGESL